jgi:hypothetical protein
MYRNFWKFGLKVFGRILAIENYFKAVDFITAVFEFFIIIILQKDTFLM